MAIKKTMHELCKEFPDKTYRELELYRDADRQEEAAKIPLTESQRKQEELEPIGMGHNHPPEEKGICMMGEMRKDREESDWPPDGITFKEKYEKERKLRREAEGETSIVKGIGQNSPEIKTLRSEVEALKQQLFVDRKKAEEHLSVSLAINESHRKLNGKLQERLTAAEQENKKMHNHLNRQIQSVRKAGL